MSNDLIRRKIYPGSGLTLEEKYERQWSIGWRLPAKLLGPLPAVFAIAIGHDQYLISLHASFLGSYNDQLIAKGTNNGLATISGVLLGVSMTAALNEIVRRGPIHKNSRKCLCISRHGT